jgi:hypothetical protein
MSPDNSGLTLQALQRTLLVFLKLAGDLWQQTECRLIGTGAALLHGVVLPANDVDILVKQRSDVDAFHTVLGPHNCILPPTWLPEQEQYYANYDLDGVEIGFSTVEVESEKDTIETFGRGPWEHFRALRCGAYSIPTVALELRLHTELHRNRPDRYEPILQHMRIHGCTRNLMTRCITLDCNLSDDLKRKVQEIVQAPTSSPAGGSPA